MVLVILFFTSIIIVVGIIFKLVVFMAAAAAVIVYQTEITCGLHFRSLMTIQATLSVCSVCQGIMKRTWNMFFFQLGLYMTGRYRCLCPVF